MVECLENNFETFEHIAKEKYVPPFGFSGIYTNLQMIYFSNETFTFLLEMNLSATNASAHDICMQTYTCVAPYVVFFHVGSFFWTDKQTKEE